MHVRVFLIIITSKFFAFIKDFEVIKHYLLFISICFLLHEIFVNKNKLILTTALLCLLHATLTIRLENKLSLFSWKKGKEDSMKE